MATAEEAKPVLTDLDKPLGQAHWRQLGIVSPKDLGFPVQILGAGSVGSFSALALAKMGVEDITVFDEGTVDDAMVAGEFYGPADCGTPKFETVVRNVHRQTATVMKSVKDFRAQPFAGVVINTIPGIETRAEVWKKVRLKPKVKRYIDATLMASHGVIYVVSAIDADDMSRYEATLSAPNVSSVPFTTAQAMVASGFLANLVKRHARREKLPTEMRFDMGRLFVQGVVDGEADLEAKGLRPCGSFSFSQPVTIIGAGAIGSMAVLALAKSGVRDLVVYDFDRVEDHNYPNQYYGPKDIGRPKVEALAELVERQTGVVIKAVIERFETQGLDGPLIVAVDSMKVRSAVWRHVKEARLPVPWLVDPRMGGQAGNVYTVFPDDAMSVAQYEKTLYSDEDAVEDPCTARAIIYNVMVIGGVVADVVRRIGEGLPPSPAVIIDLLNMFMVAD